ncbi:hypothetical protein QBC38DRAFT_152545 [Podospora fimiseda]|uniref:Heterokaryon incompatibility domain-containing protein n=1 Tax=Podospora fimiseda TaxID=252190 RepID=A0AAN6YLZ1_9PEZI|nr:hypothetical protein QBC38DRAFT_152545 [Podospora fimiseda]
MCHWIPMDGLDAGRQIGKSPERLGVAMLRIWTSGWMLRLWTLQEAVLARKIYFAFADEQVDMDEILVPLTDNMFRQTHLHDLRVELA